MDIDLLKQAYDARNKFPRPTYKELAQTYLGDATKEKQLKAELDKYTRSMAFTLPETDNELPARTFPLFSSPIHLVYRPSLLLADLHAPHTDLDGLQYAVATAIGSSIDQVIIAGDIFNAGSLSTYTKHWEKETPIEVDLEYGFKVLRWLKKKFKRVVVIPGNHDESVMKHYGVTAEQLFAEFYTTQYPYIFMGDKIMIGHLESYHVIPGMLASQIAAKYNRHVFVGHDHMAGEVISGSVSGVSIGGMLLAHNIYYKESSFNALPHWTNGFVLLNNNSAWLYRKERSDYRLYQAISEVH